MTTDPEANTGAEANTGPESNPDPEARPAGSETGAGTPPEDERDDEPEPPLNPPEHERRPGDA